MIRNTPPSSRTTHSADTRRRSPCGHTATTSWSASSSAERPKRPPNQNPTARHLKPPQLKARDAAKLPTEASMQLRHRIDIIRASISQGSREQIQPHAAPNSVARKPPMVIAHRSEPRAPQQSQNMPSPGIVLVEDSHGLHRPARRKHGSQRLHRGVCWDVDRLSGGTKGPRLAVVSRSAPISTAPDSSLRYDRSPQLGVELAARTPRSFTGSSRPRPSVTARRTQ